MGTVGKRWEKSVEYERWADENVMLQEKTRIKIWENVVLWIIWEWY